MNGENERIKRPAATEVQDHISTFIFIKLNEIKLCEYVKDQGTWSSDEVYGVFISNKRKMVRLIDVSTHI